jgi:hypothetical protein
MSINWERYDAVLAYIEQHPEEWNQEVPLEYCRWCCFGAHARRMYGPQRPDASTYEVMVRAFGVSMEESYWLFDSRRTLADFKAFRLAGGIPGGAK